MFTIEEVLKKVSNYKCPTCNEKMKVVALVSVNQDTDWKAWFECNHCKEEWKVHYECREYR